MELPIYLGPVYSATGVKDLLGLCRSVPRTLEVSIADRSSLQKLSVSLSKTITRTCVSSSREAKKLSAAVAQLILSLSRNKIVQE